MSKKKHSWEDDKRWQNYVEGFQMVNKHPVFKPLLARSRENSQKVNLCPDSGWAVVTPGGEIHVNAGRSAEPQEWAYILAHCLLHLGFDHFHKKSDPFKWNMACDCFVDRFLEELNLGTAPVEFRRPVSFLAASEESLYQQLLAGQFLEDAKWLSTAGPGGMDMVMNTNRMDFQRKINWKNLLGKGLSNGINFAINVAGGFAEERCTDENPSVAQKTHRWFISSYPLLGALAASFEIIEDPRVCIRNNISIAAVNAETRELFINRAAGLEEDESKFVMAHELLHVALQHQRRCQGRDPYLWNIACDYVINGWLVEIAFGDMPRVGLLYDSGLSGLSAEAVYDRIVTDMRRFRKLATLRGGGLGDIMEGSRSGQQGLDEGTDLDEFYRRCLAHGLLYHEENGRGFLPAGLIEEIRALSQPPVPWDVELAQWFDSHFPPLVKVRSYVRLSRRQSASPDIPRPGLILPKDQIANRTYGVVLDTSGSMSRSTLGKALGAIAAYSISRDVPAVRVIFCDASAYDQGYMPTEDIADRVKVRGRGGTVLQPGVDLLEEAKDFPKDGPILIITDGDCDRLRVSRSHAFLIPKGNQLPFIPKGTVFRIC